MTVVVHSVTRKRLKKNGLVAKEHTIRFSSLDKAQKFVQASKRLDALNKRKHNWQYQTISAAIY